jgi:uncharacterized OsmC-like protein
MAEKGFALTLERLEDFQFQVTFDEPEMPSLLVDEPEPLGSGQGPNPTRLLGAAVGNCLSASLLFCLGKSRIDVESMKTRVRGSLERNDEARWRVAGLEVTIEIDVPAEKRGGVDRCLGMFEDYCIVTASVRRGIEVDLRVETLGGEVLMESTGKEG